MQGLGIDVLLTVGHHRKVTIIDDDILWEGSLNILPENDSCEIIRRIRTNEAVDEMIMFIGSKRYLRACVSGFIEIYQKLSRHPST